VKVELNPGGRKKEKEIILSAVSLRRKKRRVGGAKIGKKFQVSKDRANVIKQLKGGGSVHKKRLQ